MAIALLQQLASNPNTLVHWLELFAQDLDEGVRYYIARNPNTPLDLLKNGG